jgi:CheY-like chemotaxis protein
MDLQPKTQELAKKLQEMSARGVDLSPDLSEHLEVLERALDQILDLVDTALKPVSEPEPSIPPTDDFVSLDDLLEPTNSTSLAPPGEISVLLVEDNMVNRKLAVLILERIGCKVDVANNGAVGFEKFKSGNYHAIFMDCQMPVMDGYEATVAIRKLEAGNSHIPIIAVTANAMKGDKEKCLDCGMDDYISKPIKPNDLQEAVSRWCKVHA